MDCVFCKIAKKEIPSRIITETEKSIAFLDVFPLSQGHTLIIPKCHYEKVQDMTDIDNIDLFNCTKTKQKIHSFSINNIFNIKG